MRSKLFISLTSALIAGALAVPAFAEEPVVAKLRAPLSNPAKPVAAGAVFDCLGDVCAARTPTLETAGIHGCRDLVRQVGAVASFGSNSKPLSADQLASCNQAARR